MGLMSLVLGPVLTLPHADTPSRPRRNAAASVVLRTLICLVTHFRTARLEPLTVGWPCTVGPFTMGVVLARWKASRVTAATDNYLTVL